MRSAGGSGPRGRLPLLLLALMLWGASAQLTNNGAKPGKACPTVCTSCSGDGSCESCASGAMQVGGPSAAGGMTCVKCQDPLCEECGPTPSQCQSCFVFWSSYVLASAPDYDYSKGDWPIYKRADGRCRKCANHPLSSGCRGCDRNGRCNECLSGYILAAGGVCKKCKGGDSCEACDPVTLQCTGCTSGTGFDSKRQCRKCAARLDEEGNAVCTNCMDDYRVCESCDEGYYMSARKQCLKLPEGCEEANANGECTQCSAGGFLTAAKQCVSCGRGCGECASATTCNSCGPGYALTAAKTCLKCSADCVDCTIVSPGRTRCNDCGSLALVGGECRRCDDPRCSDCSGSAHVCKACHNEAYIVNNSTGRCQDPSWPQPCRQSGGSAGRRGGCGAPGPQKPKLAQAGRRLQAPVVAPAIINGQNATRGRYPYMVSLRGQDKAKRSKHNCGGALVHERVVLTAAHCLLDELQWSDESTVFTETRIGGYERNGGRYEARRVKWAVVHPAVVSNDGHLVNDVALLLLDRPSTTRPLLRLPGAVPRPAAAPGTPLTAIGWGIARDKNGNSYDPALLQEAVVGMMAVKDCPPYFDNGDAWGTQFCAGPPEKRTDTCQGDSGGPLIARSSTVPAGDLAVGVVSWGDGCAAKTPGVYADVAAVSPWIHNTIQWLLHEDSAGRIPGPPTAAA